MSSATLIALLTFAAAQPSNQQEQVGTAVQVADTYEEEPGFLETTWPLWLDDDFDPLVSKGLWTFWLGGCIPVVPFGNIWLPIVVIDAPLDMGEYLLDAIIIEIVHLVPHLLVIPAAFVLIFAGAIAGVASGGGGLNLPLFLGGFAAGYGLLALNGICLAVNWLWCVPVATANAYNRAVAAERASFRRRAEIAPVPRGDVAMAF